MCANAKRPLPAEVRKRGRLAAFQKRSVHDPASTASTISRPFLESAVDGCRLSPPPRRLRSRTRLSVSPRQQTPHPPCGPARPVLCGGGDGPPTVHLTRQRRAGGAAASSGPFFDDNRAVSISTATASPLFGFAQRLVGTPMTFASPIPTVPPVTIAGRPFPSSLALSDPARHHLCLSVVPPWFKSLS